MAEKSIIISAEEEAILLKPIDEYVGKIQEQIDALRVEGSDKVNSLKNQSLPKEQVLSRLRQNTEKSKQSTWDATSTKMSSARHGKSRAAFRG